MEELLKQLNSMLEKGTNLVEGQLPEVCKEIIEYEKKMLFKSLFITIPINLILIILTSVVSYFALHLTKNDISSFLTVVLAIILVIGTFVALACTITDCWEDYLTLVKIKTAPKVFIVEKLKRLTGK